ncbi:MAG: class A beta-lactamase-related serine hydrolase, partial [Cyclobacteriaceae bacterium]|nr:class A beta-lactamase-related serine hydrolase [Cyclobacteriaceae bacterium]
HDSVYSGQRSMRNDSTAQDRMPSIAHYAKKILIVSDNDASNALYEFVGQKAVNEKLSEKGYAMRILHRLERPLSPDQNRHTEAVRFVENGKVIYQQSMLVNPDSIRPPEKVLKGMGYMKGDQLVQQPFDFTYKNFYSLNDQQMILRSIVFPGSVNPRKRFNLTEDDRKFVLQYMSQLPTQTLWPPYKKDTALYDAYCKFLLYGEDRAPIPSSIRVFNKVGDAYGYLLDNAYVVDFDKGIEFMLSTVINTNTDGIYNDGKYEYKTIGFPFMKDLGQLIYQYELKRARAHRPDLSEFKLTYDQ